VNIRIKAAGALFDYLVIDGAMSSCGKINGGIGAYLHDNYRGSERAAQEGGFVLAWEDFERAYLELKAERAKFSPSGGKHDG